MSDKRPIRYVVNPKPKAPEQFPEGSWDRLREVMGYKLPLASQASKPRVTH